MDNSIAINPDEILSNIQGLVLPTDHWLSNLANAAAVVFDQLPDVSWVGWYLFDGTVLNLGPFLGPVACTIINPNNGVCGATFTHQRTHVVDNVHDFPGHIACDPNSKSELVVPLTQHKPIGVFDLDSYSIGRFGAVEQDLCERIVQHVAQVSDFTKSVL